MVASKTSRDTAQLPAQRPGDIFSAMRAEMDRVFDRFHFGLPAMPDLFGVSNAGVMVPRLDLKDTGKTIVIEAELPGVDEKDVSVTVQGGILTLKGEKRQSKEDKDENHYVMERSYGSFLRSLKLPDGIDDSKVDAHFDKGVLTITAEKRPESVKAEKRIEIRKG